MAQRRMFSPQIVASEEFLTMPISSQALYFHLGMSADDDGFIQPKMIMRSVGSSDDDLKVLLAKRFLLPFESGVVVIKHWLIHNLIQKDRYHPTRFQEEKKQLFLKENKAYTDNEASVNKMLTQVRLGKVKEEEIQVVSDSENTPKKERTNLEGWATFVDVYPKKEDLARGSAEWRTMSKEERELAMEAVKYKNEHFLWSEYKFIPTLKTYLGGKRWEDKEKEPEKIMSFGKKK